MNTARSITKHSLVASLALAALAHAAIGRAQEQPSAELPAAELPTADAGTEDDPTDGGTAEPAAPAPPVAPAPEGSARLEGVVVEAATGRPIGGARILVSGVSGAARSAADGRYGLDVPPGLHDVSLVHPGYATISRVDLEIESGAVTALDFDAEPVRGVDEEYVVTAKRIEGSAVAMQEERMESGSVTDVIGLEQMSKAGDADAAAALKRMTGITVVGGKYVYVRGLGERYSSTLLNGSTLPSPEPERRVVPLDMFPASVLESMVIAKTYSPDLPGEFAGGAVLLRTRGFPDDLRINASLGTRYNQGTTFTEGLRPRVGNDLDWLGVDGGFREIPEEVAGAGELRLADMFSGGEGYTPEELDAITRSMPNRWGTRRDMIPPDLVVNLGIGDSFQWRRLRFGAMLSTLYENAWDSGERDTTDYTIGAGGVLTPGNRYHFEETTNTITLGGLLTVGIDLTEDHTLRLNTLVDRITDNEARVYEGFNTDTGGQIRPTRLQWVERMLLAQQVIGHHVIEPLMGFEADWRYTWSRATRNQPGTSEVRYDLEESTGTWYLSSRPDGNSLQYTDVRDDNHDLGFDLALPFEQWTDEEARVKVGGALMLKDRETDTRRFNYTFYGDIADDPAVLVLPPEQVFVDENLGVGGFLLNEATRATDNYTGEQTLRGLYAMTDFPLGLGFRILGGLRVERSEQIVRTFALFAADETPIETRLITTDYLPAATVSYEIIAGMLVRAGLSRTVNRPDFGELSPAPKTDVIGSGETQGNPNLKRALIENYDTRWEWYFSDDESVSFGGFFKKFTNPIEMIVVPSTGILITYENAEAARSYGLELDFRKDFGFAHSSLDGLYVSGNLALIRSQIELPPGGNQTSRDRPLQGQSPFVVNAQLGYDLARTGTSLVLAYNVQGERIARVGYQGAPDVYEQPFHQLDFVASQDLPLGFKLSFKAKNLIDGEVRFLQGGETTEVFRKGRSFGLTLSWAY